MFSKKTSENKEIPNIFHYIWIGSVIPRRYFLSLIRVAHAAFKSNFEINLWVDKTSNFYKAAVFESISIPNLKVRLIQTELLDLLNDSDFYQGMDSDFPLSTEEHRTTRARLYKSYIGRELIGFHNLAAASDLLRYEILRKEGGWYIDIDTFFSDLDFFWTPKKKHLVFPKNSFTINLGLIFFLYLIRQLKIN